jgi:hypothetical protein
MANDVLHCVQCSEEIAKGVVVMGLKGTHFLPVCNNEKCANYGLVQLGIENMERYDKARNRNVGAFEKKA